MTLTFEIADEQINELRRLITSASQLTVEQNINLHALKKKLAFYEKAYAELAPLKSHSVSHHHLEW